MKIKNLLGSVLALSLLSCSNTSSKVDSSSNNNSTSSSNQTTSSEKESSQVKELNEANLFMVGDSTMCAFNDAYYYPRYGYGTQLNLYMNQKLNIKNLAMSGRSSKSFLQEENYQTLKTSLNKNDYLLIGFGHNDEKIDDAARYTNPTGGVDDPTSFKYSLYTNYIKLALDKGANPILATPIVRLDTADNYTGSSAHIVNGGDYAKCIIDLGKEYNIPVIDLTSATKSLYETLSFNEAINFHAWTTSNKDSVDKTHLNIYGAKKVAYTLVNLLKNLDTTLKDYILTDIVEPTKEKDLVSNPNYVEKTYTPFDENTYTPSSNFASITKQGWYGTAFGDTGGDPTKDASGYFVKEENDIFTLGQNASGNYKGKISSSSDGFSFCFRQVEKSKNFEITAKIKVLTELNQKQAGFGLMLRDDVYTPTKDASILSNYVASGLTIKGITDTSYDMRALFTRENTKLNYSNNTLSEKYNVDDVVEAKIVRLGQVVTATLTYKGNTYEASYPDFDLFAIDNQYMYVGMFATRGTTIECSEVNYVETGTAIDA